MTNRQPGNLSKNDLRFLKSLLDKALEETDSAIKEGSGDKKVALLRRRQIIRIGLALTDNAKFL